MEGFSWTILLKRMIWGNHLGNFHLNIFFGNTCCRMFVFTVFGLRKGLLALAKAKAKADAKAKAKVKAKAEAKGTGRTTSEEKPQSAAKGEAKASAKAKAKAKTPKAKVLQPVSSADASPEPRMQLAEDLSSTAQHFRGI